MTNEKEAKDEMVTSVEGLCSAQQQSYCANLCDTCRKGSVSYFLRRVR